MSRDLEFHVEESYNNAVLSVFLKSKGFSRRIINKLKKSNSSYVNGDLCKLNLLLKTGDKIIIQLSDDKILIPAKIDVPIVYEDNDVIVFDKPAQMPTHPSLNHPNDTLGNFYAYHCSCSFRPINRLDKDTSGLCVVAKNQFSASMLSKNVNKVYFAAVEGIINESGEIIAPIARENGSIIKRKVSSDGQFSHTIYFPIKNTENHTLLKVILKTGRTHQIRVHFSHIGHPLAGDDMYGGRLDAINRQALHCGIVSFNHPVTGDLIELCSDLPTDIKTILN